MIDRKAIRESLSVDNIVHLMQLLGATEFEDRGSYLQFHTICHNIEESEGGFNLSYYKDSHRFYCFSNCHSMDIFTLIKRRWELLHEDEDTHFENIAFWVMNHCNVDLDDFSPTLTAAINPKDYQGKTVEITLPEKNVHVLETFSKHHVVEWLRDGISDEAMDLYNIRYSISRNAVIIPHYDVHGRLVGIRRRALNPEEAEKAKYKPLYIEGASYSHPLGYNLYGLNIIKDEAKIQRRIIIAEGEKSCLQGYTIYGKHNVVVAACGSKINRWQVHLIMKYCAPTEIIVAFDKGLDLDQIKKMCERYSMYCNFSYVCDPFNKLKDKESPFDRPDILEELINTRVKVV